MSFKMAFTFEQKKEIERLLRLKVPLDKICKITGFTKGSLTNEIYRIGFNSNTYTAEKSQALRESKHRAAIEKLTSRNKKVNLNQERITALEKEVEMLKMQIEILIDHIKGEK
jgi:IS30 family transposase